jgi:hypothetical protein
VQEAGGVNKVAMSTRDADLERSLESATDTAHSITEELIPARGEMGVKRVCLWCTVIKGKGIPPNNSVGRSSNAPVSACAVRLRNSNRLWRRLALG